jgi:hypothetical protein
VFNYYEFGLNVNVGCNKMVVYIRVFVASWRVHPEIKDKLKNERIFLLKRKKKKLFS